MGRAAQPGDDARTMVPTQVRSPSELLGLDELAELEEAREAIYALWPDLTLAYANPAWRSFVDTHEGALAIARRWELGESVLEAVDGDLRLFYERILRACLTSGRPWHHDFECSGRDKACRYRIDVRPLSGRRGLVVAHASIVECPHAFVPCCTDAAQARSYEDEHGLVVQCIHCRRVRRVSDPTRWDLVPAWVERTPDHASGGLCETCARLHFPSFCAARAAASAPAAD